MPSPSSADGASIAIHTSAELGELVKDARRAQGLLQTDLAGLSGTGNRFVVDLERGKPTLQLQKVLDMLDLLGLEVRVGPKRVGRP
ncbi:MULTISPECIES: helix-turn-helix transcriptional regulator [Achromobacter]|uniref:Transcriptional regulator n=2 Tax=Achromobacter TaxID=222 RepID=A0A0X8P234_ALCXX|nr:MULTISPECIES: helix-turn-helix transcriptional regulator [Achromobacter]AMG38477.1 transcriptional regulator [Achromobacter xylosoxidans]AMG44762.1 transcriptional regulator [Achromobacter xylosoxidans]EGP47125.1 helix-turn-helix family protein 15 [Achromobacter insuavis AXX-A]CUI26326.1 transcriptional regulator%2C y4mF family [Achromobacter ruhlandii]CUI40217.1 transcriptional regulator%2C y4mF family [Achromobacter ruhlandii]